MAQQPNYGPPVTHLTAKKLSFAIDLNADTRTDAIVVDRVTGSFITGISDVSGVVTWTEPADTGLTEIEAGALAHFINSSTWSLALTSSSFNRVQYVPLDGSELPSSVGLAFPEPKALCMLDAGGMITSFITGFRKSGGIDVPLVATNSSFPTPTLWQSALLGANPRRANPVYTFQSGLAAVGIAVDAAAGPGARLQFFNADIGSASLAGEFGGLPADVAWTSGLLNFDLDQTTQNYRSTTILAWSPNDSLLRTARLTDVDTVNNVPFAGLTLVSGTTFNLARLIREIYVLDGPTPRLLVVWADVAGGASIFEFDGTHAPTLVESLNLDSLSLDAVLPMVNDGDFLLLGNRSGVPTYDRMHWNGSSYVRTATGPLPQTPRTPLYSNIIAFNGEPFVNPDAFEVQRRRIKDWTSAATLNMGSAQVTALADNGALIGLGGASSSTVSVPFDATHALPSQLDAASSLAILSNRTISSNSLPTVKISPPGGSYSGSSLTINLTSTDALIFYSLNDGPWQTLGNFFATDHLITINASTTLRTYASKPFGGFGGRPSGQGAIITASYTLSTLPPVQEQPTVDDNHNGLSDAWENLTGISQPGEDDDGDGFLNLAEHNSGTDPFNANDHPSITTTAPDFEVVDGAGPALKNLRWSAHDTAIVLQSSPDLTTWTVVTQNIRTEGAEKVFDLPLNSFPRRFYRLRR